MEVLRFTNSSYVAMYFHTTCWKKKFICVKFMHASSFARFLEVLMHAFQWEAMWSSLFRVWFVMDFENIAISSPGYYKFINLYPMWLIRTFRWEKSKNRLEVSYKSRPDPREGAKGLCSIHLLFSSPCQGLSGSDIVYFINLWVRLELRFPNDFNIIVRVSFADDKRKAD